MDIWPGRPYPMGATPDSEGTNVAVFSSTASPGSITLCLFADDGTETGLPLTHRTGNVWHGYVPGVGAGQRYGFRSAGPWDPAHGLWGNRAKLLMDPYARAVDGAFDGDPSTVTRQPGDRVSADSRDSAPHVPRSVVVDPSYDWSGDKPPGTAMSDTVIYETHVRGITKLHPLIPDTQRGTYAGLASAPIIGHLTSLGVTAVELMPIHQFVSEPRLLAMGLSNYWGYQSVGYFAPHGAYSSTGSRGQQVTEFKSMVKALHAAGIEVILDVVFNHTGEGSLDGPTLAYRGLDNLTYYRTDPGDPSRYVDLTGTGNTLSAAQPEVLRLIMSSLRYWVTEMHVDGFRFDLASVLARQLAAVDRLSAFLDLVYQDPVVSQVKLIAEPWDLGADGYQLGHFPSPWSEWNDRFRGGVRDFWRQATGIGELATRLAGSSDVFQTQGLPPQASINFITAHDGFTLTDLVSYDGKHNDANGENNRDGSDDNRSWNCGTEGSTTDPAILDLRNRQRRNLLSTLVLSQGVPMILGGDEIGRTQQGNNNAYCQDNTVSWCDWQLDQAGDDLMSFTRNVIALRKAHPSFRRRGYLTGQPTQPGARFDVEWIGPDGNPMTQAAWTSGLEALGMWMDGTALADTDAKGHPLTDDTLLLLVNGSSAVIAFTLPAADRGASWTALLDTSTSTGQPAAAGPVTPGSQVDLTPRSLVLLRRSAG